MGWGFVMKPATALRLVSAFLQISRMKEGGTCLRAGERHSAPDAPDRHPVRSQTAFA